MRLITKEPLICSLLFLFLVLIISPELLASTPGEGEQTGYSAERWRDFGLRVLNFVAFAFILYFLLRKIVKNFFQAKTEGISRQLEYLETQATNLEEQNQTMKRRLSQLTQEREGILAQYERDGQKERDRIIAEAHQTADQIVKKAQVAMSQELSAAKRNLTKETGTLAVDMARDIIVQNITPEDKNALVHNFLEQLTKLNTRQ
ncbi:MAG: ATP synthase F0 subunit B [Deltaproteobacteria bacterium]|jgi:F-type H+-transporting ATPase subunit b|nr:ATP synthase F0 subunit B [Deltaproteobacteria bacterium]